MLLASGRTGHGFGTWLGSLATLSFAGTRTHPGSASVTSAVSVWRRSNRRAALPATPSYTPKHLADKILKSKSALEGERK